jgi:hypothetical protein
MTHGQLRFGGFYGRLAHTQGSPMVECGPGMGNPYAAVVDNLWDLPVIAFISTSQV